MKDLEADIQSVIERYSLLIRQVIQRRLHPGDAIDLDDIEQEVRLKIWSFLKKGKRVDHLPSYIKKVAFSTTIDALRKLMKQRESGPPETVAQILVEAGLRTGRSGERSPEARLEDAEARTAINALVASLSENRRKVLTLFLAGQTIDEISSSLHWDKTRVRHLFYRGLDDLKARGKFPACPNDGAASPPGEKA